MESRPQIISTKKINDANRTRLTEVGMDVYDSDFIAIDFKSIEGDTSLIQNTIAITSPNSVRALKAADQLDLVRDKTIYCVGTRIPELLSKENMAVEAHFNNARELGTFLQKQNPGHIDIICGNRSRPELTELLSASEISFTKWVNYETRLTPHQSEVQPSAVLFFSPSGVESYTSANTIKDEKIICIGNTTRKAVEPFSSNIYIADHQKMESVITKTITVFQ